MAAQHTNDTQNVATLIVRNDMQVFTSPADQKSRGASCAYPVDWRPRPKTIWMVAVQLDVQTVSLSKIVFVHFGKVGFIRLGEENNCSILSTSLRSENAPEAWIDSGWTLILSGRTIVVQSQRQQNLVSLVSLHITYFYWWHSKISVVPLFL